MVILVRSEHSNHQIDFHDLLLLCGQVSVGGQLQLDSLCELLPIQVSNQVLGIFLADLIGFLKGVDVQLKQILILYASGYFECRVRLVLDVVYCVIKAVDHVQFLHFKPCQVTLITSIVLSLLKGFIQMLH